MKSSWRRILGTLASACSLAVLTAGCGGNPGGDGSGGGNGSAGGGGSGGGNGSAGGGNGTAGSGTIVGTYENGALPGSVTGTSQWQDGIYATGINFDDIPNLCGTLTSREGPRSSQRLQVIVYSADTHVAVGSYTVTDKPPYTPPSVLTARARVLDYDDNCSMADSAWATGGSVIVSKADGLHLTGSFQATFFNGDALSGTFDSTDCAVDTSLQTHCP